MSKYESDLTRFCKNSKTFESDTVSPHILYDFYIGNEAAREEAELKEAARWELSQQLQCNDGLHEHHHHHGLIMIIIMMRKTKQESTFCWIES